MLEIYITDDDISILRILENIIEDNNLGRVIESSSDSRKAIEDILNLRPDIVIVDLLMPNMDGVEIINKVKRVNKDIKFIMLSQVNSKDMISKAYDSGVEFFITKPINIIEVKRVIKNVTESINMKRQLESIENIFNESNENKDVTREENDLKNIKIILNRIGIMGEKGAEEIIDICLYLIQRNESIFDYKISEICKKISENPKASEQRIRRAVNKGLSNLANIGIEDYMNEIFTRYSNSLYNFEDVRTEMEFIRGKRDLRGRISIKKFIDSLLMEKDFNTK